MSRTADLVLFFLLKRSAIEDKNLFSNGSLTILFSIQYTYSTYRFLFYFFSGILFVFIQIFYKDINKRENKMKF